MNKRLALGMSSSAFLIVLIIWGWMLFKEQQARQAHIGGRFPLQSLNYCSTNHVTPCVVSFSLDSNGNMIVNFLTTGAFYPDFYLKIKQDEDDHIYNCQKVSKFATNVYCTGTALPLGQIFQFSIFSIKEEVLLAEGNFSIIGLALGTPIVAVSSTLGTPLTPSEVPTLQTPTAAQLTPSATSTPTLPPSYPGTSYPNPSYP